MNRFIKKISTLLILVLFLLFPLFLFQPYILKGDVPFPSNLLVSFYEPWKSYDWKGYPNGPPNKPLGFDNLRIFYPLRNLVASEIKHGRLPLWNPYNFSGNTLLATYQSAVFHPLSFLFLLLPIIDAWSIIVLLTPFFAASFMFLFLRSLSLSKKAALFGSIAFAYSHVFLVWWEESFMLSYSFLFLPLCLFGVEKIIQKKRTGFIIVTASIVGSIISGWFQMTLYMLLLSFAWVLFRVLKTHMSKQVVWIFLLGLIMAILISGIHLIPSFEAFTQSARSSTDAKYLFTGYLQPIAHLITLFAPDFFGNPAVYNYFGKGFYHESTLFFGIPSLLFFFYAIFKREKSLPEKFFLWSGVVFLSLGLSLPTSWIILYYLKLPLVSVLIPSRIFFLSVFCFVTLAAFGFDAYSKTTEKKAFLLSTFSFLGFVVIGAVLLLQFFLNKKIDFLSISIRNMIIPLCLFLGTFVLGYLGIYKKKFLSLVFIGVILILLGGAFYSAKKHLYFSDRNLVFPQTPLLETLKRYSSKDTSRFWGVGDAHIESNFATAYQLFSPEGYDSFYIRRYGELLYSSIANGAYKSEIPRADALISSIGRVDDILQDRRRVKLLSLLGVKYIIEKKAEHKVSSSQQNLFKLIWEDSAFRIYEFQLALPRVFLVSDYTIESDPQKILNAVYATNLSKTVILEETPTQKYPQQTNTDNDARITSYTPTHVTVKTNSSSPSILVFSDTYYPGWNAYVDQKKVDILRANYAFRALELPKGEHTVEFLYQPISFYVGVGTTLAGILLFGIMSIQLRFKKT